jgi:hypothetical protein
MQPGDYIITIDLSKGYHHMDIDPAFWTFLGFEWEGDYYIFTSLPFGLAPACWAFTKLTRELIYRWRAMGHRCSGFLDDSYHVNQGESKVESIVQTMVIPDLQNCGFVMNMKKSMLTPKQLAEYLGMIMDTVNNRLLVPERKREKLRSLLKQALSATDACPCYLIEKLAGNLVSMHWAFGPISRLMTMSLYVGIKQAHTRKHWLHCLRTQ